MADTEKPKTLAKQATERVFAALNRADEIGGEIRDYLQDKVATDPRYVNARKRIAKLMGRKFESRDEAAKAADSRARKTAAVAATTASTTKVKQVGFGDPSLKAQIFGKKSCPWSGRAITLLERHKVDYEFLDLEEPEHEAKAAPLALETRQNTVPFVYLRGQFIGGFNALSEVERLGQLEVALMSPEEREKAPAHVKFVEIVPRPNTDEVAPAETDAST
ncbi:MAG: glutaredoxin [Deltaproteobacteria bacterium]|nr:glutaredoxin [Deltaproteobacteria bacterium]